MRCRSGEQVFDFGSELRVATECVRQREAGLYTGALMAGGGQPGVAHELGARANDFEQRWALAPDRQHFLRGAPRGNILGAQMQKEGAGHDPVSGVIRVHAVASEHTPRGVFSPFRELCLHHAVDIGDVPSGGPLL